MVPLVRAKGMTSTSTLCAAGKRQAARPPVSRNNTSWPGKGLPEFPKIFIRNPDIRRIGKIRCPRGGETAPAEGPKEDRKKPTAWPVPFG